LVNNLSPTCWKLNRSHADGISGRDNAQHIASLIDPAKLATLGKRGANQRVEKAVYWLAEAREAGQKPDKVMDATLGLAGVKNGPAAELTKAALLRNLDIAEKLGCLDAEGMAEMRKGKAPTVRRGPYKGQELSVDHIIPRAIVPELDNVIANLELLPLRINEKKNASIGDRQLSHAQKLYDAGLLSAEGLNKVQSAEGGAIFSIRMTDFILALVGFSGTRPNPAKFCPSLHQSGSTFLRLREGSSL
jgi:hypothetical protein